MKKWNFSFSFFYMDFAWIIMKLGQKIIGQNTPFQKHPTTTFQKHPSSELGCFGYKNTPASDLGCFGYKNTPCQVPKRPMQNMGCFLNPIHPIMAHVKNNRSLGVSETGLSPSRGIHFLGDHPPGLCVNPIRFRNRIHLSF